MKLIPVLLLVFVFSGIAVAQDGNGSPESLLVLDASAPVELDNYGATFGGPRGQAETVVHSIRFKSKSPSDLHAVQIGFLSFDLMGQMMDHHVETYVRSGRPNPEVVMGYVMDSHNRSSFASSIAYLRAVRYTDGRVWKADLNQVVSRARQIDSNVNMDWVLRF